VARDHAVVTVEPHMTLRVPFGQAVTVEGTTTRLVKAPTSRRARPAASDRSGGDRGRLLDLDDEPPIDDQLFEALRGWRSRVAAELGLPAYLIFHDRHLQLIAGRKPGTLRDLAACPGVGPTKLERYGDDVLDLVAAHP